MKKLMMVIVAGLACAVVAETVKPTMRRTSGAERRARYLAKVAAEGGLVQAPVNGKTVRIMTKSAKAPVADLEVIAKEITGLMGFVVDVVDSEKTTKHAAGCMIAVLEQGEKSPTLTVAPEDTWATVNVSRLMADKPTDEVLKLRIKKEVWRAFGYVLGAANSMMQPCVMRPIHSLKDLDSNGTAIMSPDRLPSVQATSEYLGFARTRTVTYKTACAEGWAPAPTNDVQRAIAAEVKDPKKRFEKDFPDLLKK